MRKLSKGILIGIVAIVIFIAILFAVGVFPIDVVRMNGNSMNPTLLKGDELKADFKFKALERGDIVLYWYPKDVKTEFAHRIVGLPGENVKIVNGKIFINNELLNEKNYFPQVPESTPGDISLQLKGNEYFVIGDNRNESFDSRSWGPLAREYIEAVILGKKIK